ncbi:MAG: hypothetical protein EOO88_50615, partial [Pedobacter sp.]
DNKLPDFAASLLRVSRELNIPLLRYFEGIPEEQLIALGIEGNKRLLTAIAENKVADYLKESLRNWKENQFKEHNFNPISVNLVTSNKDTSEVAYKDLVKQNPGLEYTLQNQFIIGSNYNFTYTNQMQEKRRHNLYFFGGLETSGNVWGLFTPKDSEGKREIFNTALTQFVRVETDLRSYYKVTPTVIWANRLNLGYGYAYGGSASLPFVRQFFAGGTNDIRAFRARSLGPGTYQIPDNNTGFADQGGDIKMMLNSELRFKIVSVLHGAAFVDAGNIWLRKEDPNRIGSLRVNNNGQTQQNYSDAGLNTKAPTVGLPTLTNGIGAYINLVATYKSAWYLNTTPLIRYRIQGEHRNV